MQKKKLAGFAQPALVRRDRPALLRPSLARAADGLCARGLPRQAGDRHHQHLERSQPCHTHFPSASRRSSAASGRPAASRSSCRRCRCRSSSSSRPPCSIATSSRWRPRSCCAQHPVDGAVLMGGCDKTTPGDDHGRHLDEPAGDLHAGRADDARPLRRQDSRLRLRRLEILGREGSRQHQRAAVERHGGGHRPLRRHLHDDGHRLDDDDDRRGARPHAARRRVDPGRRCRASAHGLGLRPAHRRDGLGGPEAARHSHPQVRRERAGRAQRDGGLDQRDDPSRRHGAAAPACRST